MIVPGRHKGWIMSFAILTVNTTLSATMEDLWSDPGGTHSFSFSSGAEEELFILDDDATFNDLTGDGNQVVAPASTIRQSALGTNSL